MFIQSNFEQYLALTPATKLHPMAIHPHTHLPKQYWEWSEEDGVLLGSLSGMVMRGVMACVSICHDAWLVRLIQLG